jgi:hypothetical protein
LKKIADGVILGAIPRCKNWFGGRHIFKIKTGTYYCPGYIDDEDFKNCQITFTFSEL